MTKIASKPTVLHEIDGPDTCEMCGATGLKTELVRNPFIYGTGSDAVELSADIPVHTCTPCAVSFTGDEAATIEHEAVCRHLGVLTPAEIRALRNRYGLSRAAFSRVTGFGEATLARWEGREVIQNSSSDRYLRLLQDPATFRRLRALANSAATEGAGTSIGVRASVTFRRLSSIRQNQFREHARSWSPRGTAA